MNQDLRTTKLIEELINCWRDFYAKPEYYINKHIPEIIKNPRKRTIWENTLISCINDDQKIITFFNDAYENKLTIKLNSQISSLLSSYKFSEADKIFSGNKERLIMIRKEMKQCKNLLLILFSK